MYNYYRILAIFPMLYNTSLSLSHTQQFVSLRPPPSCPTLPLVTTSLFSVSVSLFLFFFKIYSRDCCILKAAYISDTIQLSFPDLSHLAQGPPSSAMLLQMEKFHSFFCVSSIPLCVCVCVCVCVYVCVCVFVCVYILHL